MNAKHFLVPLMACGAGVLMSCAWIAHLKFKDMGWFTALAMSWMFVLPEYVLNVTSARWGSGTFSGAQVAGMHIAAGIISIALVSRFYLGEPLVFSQIAGFGLMIVAVGLIIFKP